MDAIRNSDKKIFGVVSECTAHLFNVEAVDQLIPLHYNISNDWMIFLQDEGYSYRNTA